MSATQVSTLWFNGFEPLRTFFVSATPVTGVSSARPPLFPDEIDDSDPWQFRNVLVR
jgi:homospermidine synthase